MEESPLSASDNNARDRSTQRNVDRQVPVFQRKFFGFTAFAIIDRSGCFAYCPRLA
jgi:hypothetical protein